MKREAHQLQDVRANVIKALNETLEDLGHVDGGACGLVTELSLRMGRELGLSAGRLALLEAGVRLRDIGTLGVSQTILRKTSPLSPEEWSEIRSHPELGRAIVGDIGFLRPVTGIIIAHHERYDGKGYPRGLRGERIPLGARICSVADAYHSMITDRPYRGALPDGHARKEIIRNSGTQFDPRVVHAFVEVERELAGRPCLGKAPAAARPSSGVSPATRGSLRLFESAFTPESR